MLKTSQQVSRITVEGYKSIKLCSIDLKMVNVLIGSNGSGKSNFISVFTLLQDIIKHELQMHILKAGGASPFLHNGRKETSEIKILFEFGDNQYGFNLTPTDNNSLIFAREYFSYWGSGYKSPLELNLGTAHNESKWELGSSKSSINNYVQSVLRDQKWRVYHFHDTGKDAKVKQSTNISNNCDLMLDARNISAFLLRLKNDFKNEYKNIVNTIQLIAPFFSDFALEPFNSKGDIALRWRHVGTDDVFGVNQFSDGTLRFICLATLLLQPLSLMPQTIIIDEPELGLHPYAITLLSELIKKVSVNRQIILSTQSVELLNEFSPEDIIVVDRNEDGSSFSRLDANDLHDWLEEYALGELWKKNVLGGRLSK